MKKHYTVSAAIIVENKKILCVQRNKGKYDYISYKYEFPGGKLEEGENEEDALKREISEELNLEIDVIEKFELIEELVANYSMVTCGGQSSAPLLYAFAAHASGISEVEVSSSIAALSAGPATRRNIDEYQDSSFLIFRLSCD